MALYKYVAFGIVILASCLTSFVILSPSQSVIVYRNIAYPVTLLIYGLFVFALVKSLRSKTLRIRDVFNSRMFPVLLIFGVVTAVFFASGSWGFKTVMDEPLIVSASQELHYNRAPLIGWRAYNVDGAFSIMDSFLDKRPIPFAVLISLVHDLTGYRPENAFILNNLIGLASIILIGILGYRIHGRIGACLGMVLLGGLPVFIHYSNGAGFDVFNIFMVMIVILLGLKWYRDSSQWSLMAFVFAGIILCQTRYESPLFALPIGLTVLFKWWRDREVQLPWLLVVVPVLMMLIPLQQNIFKINQAFWEMDSIPDADQIWGLKYFYTNLGHAINFLWDWTDIYPNSPYLSCLGLFSFAILIAKVGPRMVEHIRRNPELFIWVVFSGGLAAHFLLTLFFFYGKLDLFIMYRFSLPVYLLAVLLSIACLRVMSSVRMKQGIFLFAIVGWFAYSIPVAAKQVYSHRYVPQLEYNWIREFAGKNNHRNLLVVGDNPFAWVLNNVSAVSYSSANRRPWKLKYHLEHRSFDDVLVAVVVGEDPKDGHQFVASKVMLSDGFKKEFISRKRIHPFFFIDLYRLVDVDVDEVIEEDKKNATKDDPFLGEDLKTDSFEFSEDQKAQQEYYLNLP